MDYGIHWFRRDLRVPGNEALKENWTKNEGRVVGLFCFDKDFLSREDFSNNRFQLFLHTLKSLQDDLRRIGSDLLVLDKGPLEAIPKITDELIELNKDKKLNLITWSRDYEPYARQRDQKVSTYLESKNIESRILRDHLLIEPEELHKDDGNSYQVYSPFARKWLKIFQTEKVQKRMARQKQGLAYLKDPQSVGKIFKLNWGELNRSPEFSKDALAQYINSNQKYVTVEIPEVGLDAVTKKLKSFENELDNYQQKRDFPNLDATSGFSLYLKNGSITVPQIISYYDLKPYEKKTTSQDTFFSELIWREFYYHILFHHPKVESQNFLSQYDNLQWENRKDWFEAWKLGKTGFPIVDAGMRQLLTTGWMHNRVRMIVASFLTKDLLIDWRWGEQYFMETLLDGDVAPNNGGWQWASSTGCDPQPYFRIFNPWSQSKKFDLTGEYIKKYIPELSGLPSKSLHEPIIGHPKYPAPIIDHAEQRKRALEMYKTARET